MGVAHVEMPMLQAELREESKKTDLKEVRRKGFVPGIVYGHNKDSINVKFHRRELERLVARYGIGSSVELQMGNTESHAIIKDIHRHVTKQHILHIDFQELSADKKVKVKLPLYLINKAEVESSTAIVQQHLMELEIETYPKYLPQFIEVDVANLEMGTPLAVQDLEIYKNKNIEVLGNIEEIVASLVAPPKGRAVVENIEMDS